MTSTSRLLVRAATFLAVLLSLVAPTALLAQGILYWDPTGSQTTTTGGTGTWNTSSALYTGTGSTTVTWVTGTGGTVAAYNNLYFGGAGQGASPYVVTTNLTSTLSNNNTLSLFFQGNYTFTRASSATTTANLGGSGSAGTLTLSVDSGKTLQLVAGTDTGSTNRIVLTSAANGSAATSVLLTGSGNIELGKNVDVTVTSANGQIRIGEANKATAVTALADSSFVAGRLSVATGSLTVNGGNVSLSGANSARGNSALFIGSVGTAAAGFAAATVNLDSGAISALPGTGANGSTYGQGKHGIVFAIDPTVLTTNAASSSTGLVGGTFNLNGGTLTTTDILANPYATTDVTAKFVFNGGTLVVSSAATQAHLDSFMTGFKDTAANHISIASGGATINTGSINTGTTDGIATIDSVIRGSGDLTKTGANTLKLSAANTYTGRTVISGGTLALGTTGTLASSEISIANGANFDVSARTGGFRLATGQNLEVAGTGLFTGTLGVGSDSTAETITLSDNLNLASGAGLLFDLGATGDQLAVTGNVSAAGNVSVHLNFLAGFTTGTYTLMSAALITDPGLFVLDEGGLLEGYNYNLLTSGSSLQLAVTAIPEPATYALLAGVLTLGLAVWRRRARR